MMTAPTRPTAVNCLGAPAPALPAFTPNPYWSGVNAIHQRMQGQIAGGSIHFIGDSITAALDVSQVTPFGLNEGIGGDTTAGVLNRLSGLTALGRAGGVVLMIGVNDMAAFTPGVTVKSHLDRLFGWLQGPLVVQKIIHIDWTNPTFHRPDGLQQWLNLNIDIINDYIAQLCAGRPDTILVDCNPELTTAAGLLRPDMHIGDGLHPNAAAYAVIRPKIVAALSQLGLT